MLLYLALFLTGLVAGFIDAVAGGGGLIAVPVLLWTGVPPQVALGTNKLQSSCGTALAAWHYGRAGLLRWRPLVFGLIVTFAAAMLGAEAVSRLDAHFLRHLIPPLLVGIAIWLWLKPYFGTQPGGARMNATAFALLFGSVLGFYDGFFGPGTGSFWAVACVALLGLELPAATGYTKAMNLASNLGALLVFLAASQVRYDFAAAMIIGQLVGARLGSGMVIARGTKFIRPIFLTMVVALAARLLWQNLRG
jgi:uncharacterized membrane protein YfcA